MDSFNSRRNFLKSLAIATTIYPASNASWAQTKFNKNPFELGVASGSPSDSSVVLWTILWDQGFFGSAIPKVSIPVAWEVATDKDFRNIVKSGVSQALPELSHSVHAEVINLPPNAWFFYRFKVGEMVSAIGKTRTLPGANDQIEEFKIAYASCQHYELGYFSLYQEMIKDQPDLVMFLGDYIYEYGTGKTGIRSFNSGHCIALDDYRKRYALYRSEKDLQDIHAACPWIFTWDDHEVQNDYAGKNHGSHGPNVSDFNKRRASAYQAYYEFMPIRASALTNGVEGLMQGSELRIYENYQIGQLASISMLDGRQYKDAIVCTPNNQPGSGFPDPKICTELRGENRSLLGMDQEKWLESQINKSTKKIWNVVGQPTLFGQRLLPSNDGAKIWNDGWDGYPIARQRLINQIATNNVPNFVVFGGDVHENWVGQIKQNYDNPSSKDLGVEFCGGSIMSYDGSQKYLQSRLKRNPHFIFADAESKSYGLAKFSPKELNVILKGAKSVRETNVDVTVLASFKVKAGSNKVERVS